MRRMRAGPGRGTSRYRGSDLLRRARVRTCMRTLASAGAYTIRKMEINCAVSRRILIGVIGVTVCPIPIRKILYLE